MNAIICSYKLSYKPDSTSSDSRSEIFKLIINGDSSLFKSKVSIMLDSLMKAYDNKPFNEENMQLMLGDFNKLPRTKFSYSIYKCVPKNEIIYYEKLGSKEYSYHESVASLNWHITSEKINVSGYICQKAIASFGGRKFEAWFTREIPVAEGPYKFCGLPGLIIKVKDVRNHYIFELLNIKINILSLFFAPPKKVIATTKQEFEKGKVVYSAGALDRMAAMGNTVTEERKQAFRERNKKRNNPLELR